jgi:hypothetical protein
MAVVTAFALSTGLAWSADEAVKIASSPAEKAQEEKRRACIAEAGKQGLKGGERTKFLRACLLKAKPA